MAIMAGISLQLINRSDVPVGCLQHCGREGVAIVTLSSGWMDVDTTWCLACLNDVDLPSVAALLAGRPADRILEDLAS